MPPRALQPILIQPGEFIEENFAHVRAYEPDEAYLRRRGLITESEPTFLLQSVRLNDPGYQGDPQALFNSPLSLLAAPLLAIRAEAAKLSRSPSKKESALERKLRQKLAKLSDEYVLLDNGLVAEESADQLPATDAVNVYGVKLPWNSVQIPLEGRGHFVAMAWIPTTNEVVFAGPDFVPTLPVRTKGDSLRGYAAVPRNRGVPLDLRATQANCGPSAVAAFLGVSSQHVIDELIPSFRDRPSLWNDQIIDGFKKAGIEVEKISMRMKLHVHTDSLAAAFKNALHPAGIALIMFSKNGQSVGEGHWVAYDRGMVYDHNVTNPNDRSRGDWIPEKRWKKEIVENRLLPVVLGKPDGFYVSTLITPKK